MRVNHDWLESEFGDPKVIALSTVRTCSLTSEGSRPLGIVWHWTAGKGDPDFAENLARSIMNYDVKKDRAASWHVLIAKNGTIYQSAAFNVGTWHVGRPGVIGGKRWVNVNKVTVGCELENAGELLKVANKYYCWPYYLNPDSTAITERMDPTLEIDPSRVVMLQAKFYDAFTAQQVGSAKALLSALVKEFHWAANSCAFEHSKFDPTRKKDPGPLWATELLPGIISEVLSTTRST